jgi:subtilisin family serine protease
MKFLKLLVYFFIFIYVPTSFANEIPKKEIVYSKSKIVVQLKSDSDETSLKSDFPNSKHILLNFYSVPVPKGKDVEQFIKEIQDKTYIKYADFSYGYKLTAIPNDTYFYDQWGLTKIQAQDAWDYTTGSDEVYVAVVDDGIDINHPDLINNIWKNPNEICGNNIDDDNNGYIDDCYGWSAIEGKGSAVAKGSHGTHIAGIIGAVGNNGIGVSGVNWNIKIIPCGAGDENGFLYDIEIAECFGYIQKLKYLNDLNIVAINASWGGYARSKLAKKVLDILAQYNILLVSAAGNENIDNDTDGLYPCSYKSDTVLCVGASTENDGKASFSNYGKHAVDIFAPGVNILSTVPYLTNEYGYYDKFSGTSMATPFVTGAVALAKSVYPDFNYKDLKKKVISSGDFIDDLSNYSITGKRLNLKKIVNGESFATYSFNTNYVNFGNVNKGEEIDKSITVQSTGEIPLVINSLELTNNEDFYIKSENCTGKQLDFYQKCEITVSFKPISGDKTVSSYLKIHSNADNWQEVFLSGSTNVYPVLSISPQIITFKNTDVGEESEIKQITLKNTGTGNLIVNNIIASNNPDYIFDFSGCPDLPFKLKENESCSISVKFIPSVEGESKSNIYITYQNGKNNLTKSVHIYGTTEHLPDLVLNKKDFYFEAPAGDYSEPQIVKVFNKGKTNLNISYIGSNYKEFIFNFKEGDKPCKNKIVTIQPNDYCTFSIKFYPENNSYKEIFSYLKIVSNDTFHKDYLVGNLYGKPLNVEVEVKPSQIDFGEYQLNEESDLKTVTITNVSKINAKLKIKDINLQNSTDFQIDFGSCGKPPFKLNQNESCQLKIKFSPKSKGTKKEKLKIISNDYEHEKIYVRLRGEGLKQAPVIYSSPTNLDFGNVQVGKISEEKILTIENKGMLPLETESIEIKSNVFLLNYKAGSNPCNSQKFVLQPKQSCTIGIRFAPNEEDNFKDDIRIKSNAKSVKIELYGNGTRGIPPKIDISTEEIDFGKVVVNQTKKQEITISNLTAKSKLIITDIQLSRKENFAVDFNGGTKPCGSSSFILPENSKCTIEISFVPSKDKRFKTDLNIYSNDPENNRERIKIYGEGINSPPAKMKISTQEINFGALQIGKEKTTEIKIKNMGEGSLNIYEFNLKEGIFKILPDYGVKPCGSLNPTINPNDYCTIGIKFNPEKDKIYKTSLELKSNDAYSKEYKIYLYGEGTKEPEGYLYIENKEVNFGKVSVETKKVKEIQISNIGEANLKIAEIRLKSENYKILTNYGTNPCGSLTPVIEPNSSCSIGVEFSPDRDRKYNESLEIKAGKNKERVKLYGQGTKDKQPFIIVDKPEISFEDTLIGNYSIQEIKIKNIGQLDLKIYEIKVSDKNGFEIVANYGTNPCNTLTPTIKPDNFCTLGIKFKPYKEKRFKSKLEIKSNDERIQVQIYGQGWEQFPPKIYVSPKEHDFGTVKIGYQIPSKIVKIENKGKGILNITSIKNKNSDFVLNFNGGDKPCLNKTPSITPDDYCTFEVIFKPVSKGEKKTTIEIYSNDKENKKIKLYFIGKALATYGIISVSPSFIDFTKNEITLIGYSSDPAKITIRNSAKDNLVIKEIKLSDNKNFVINPNYGNDKPCGSLTPIIKPDDYCTIYITFVPVEKVSSIKNCNGGFCERKVTATLKFISNDIDNSKPVIELYADSQEIKGKRYLYINPKVYDFEFTEVGGTSNPIEIKLENHNETEIEIEKISNQHLNDFQLDLNGGSKPCKNFPVKIKSDDYCTIVAYFTPKSEGFKKGSFKIKGSHPFKINEEVVLTGRTTNNEPYIHIEPRFIDFEENFIKTLSGIKEVKIQNIGTQNLVINKIEENSDYIFVKFDDGEKPCGDSWPIVLEPNDYCTFSVAFQSNKKKRETDIIKITSNDPYSSNYYITVTGIGVVPELVTGCSFNQKVTTLPIYLLILIFIAYRKIQRKIG